ncbi:MAG TPA: YkvA family protein [bacterium]|nr:YkvA family protein [bacterium]
MFDKLKQRAQHLKAETYALYLAARHPQTPWYARLLAAAVAAYLFSPIDLIPDFIPVLGYLDDLILVPLGIALAIRLIPAPVMAECRSRARESMGADKPRSGAVMVTIVAIWLLAGALLGKWLYGLLSR